MKAILLSACLALGCAIVPAWQPAEAAGCIKGAVVGGIAGHLVHHGVLGAAAGCAIGHHRAARQAETSRQDRANNPESSDNNDSERATSRR